MGGLLKVMGEAKSFDVHCLMFFLEKSNIRLEDSMEKIEDQIIDIRTQMSKQARFVAPIGVPPVSQQTTRNSSRNIDDAPRQDAFSRHVSPYRQFSSDDSF